MRLKLILILFCCWSIQANASFVQKIDSAKQHEKKHFELKRDNSKIEVRKINEEAVKNYAKQKDFNYEEVAPADTWWDKFWRAVWRFLDRLFSSGSKSGMFSPIFMQIIKYFLIALAIAIVVFVVFKVLGLDLKFLTGKSKSVEVPYEESLENIHEINFDEQLENALANENYRLAVRLLYLKTLKKLSDEQLIVWQPEKTNQAYISEIEDENQQAEFAKLTRQFEYIWYGEFFIDKNSYEPISLMFQRFNQQGV